MFGRRHHRNKVPAVWVISFHHPHEVTLGKVLSINNYYKSRTFITFKNLCKSKILFRTPLKIYQTNPLTQINILMDFLSRILQTIGARNNFQKATFEGISRARPSDLENERLQTIFSLLLNGSPCAF